MHNKTAAIRQLFSISNSIFQILACKLPTKIRNNNKKYGISTDTDDKNRGFMIKSVDKKAYL